MGDSFFSTFLEGKIDYSEREMNDKKVEMRVRCKHRRRNRREKKKEKALAF